MIANYAREWTLDIQDASGFVAEQRVHAMSGEYDQLVTPSEDVYPVTDRDVSGKLGLSTFTHKTAK